jgi:Predicted cation transporter
MLIALIVIFVLIAVLPLFVKPIEQHIELFLMMTGIAAALIAHALTLPNLAAIFSDRFLYIITVAVLVVSILFRVLENRVRQFIDFLLGRLPLKLIVFLLVTGLGLLSSVITAIISSLLLTEIVSILPIDRKNKVRISITACFSIGLGAVLTPIGEPLSTIVTSKLGQDFFFMLRLFGVKITVGVLLLGLLSTFFADNNWREKYQEGGESDLIVEKEDGKQIALRTVKIFMFVVSLMLLGYGFKPVIDTYIIHWDNRLLYVGNTVSAILDNATLAAAEISPVMSIVQTMTILISLLVSGGMLVTGNIPNIVTASKLKISMKEWAKFGLPLGLIFLLGYYFVLFHSQIFTF